ncbi:L-rhamnose-binding lectin CSL3-like [Glandiceps talaboti]
MTCRYRSCERSFMGEACTGQDRFVYACENHQLSLDCTGGAIEVVSANYGRHSTSICPAFLVFTTNCGVGSSFDKVKNTCDGKEHCALTASNGEFGDPCFLIPKYLEVTYHSCTGEDRFVYACENHQLSLDCTGGEIEVVSANYGRHSTSICPAFLVFTTDCGAGSSFDKVKSACDGKDHCALTASNGEFGDPCILIPKYLEVTYHCISKCFVKPKQPTGP